MSTDIAALAVMVKTLAGKTIIFDVESNNTVGTVKRMIEHMEGSQYHLFINDEQLKDGCTMAQYNIVNESTTIYALEDKPARLYSNLQKSKKETGKAVAEANKAKAKVCLAGSRHKTSGRAYAAVKVKAAKAEKDFLFAQERLLEVQAAVQAGTLANKKTSQALILTKVMAAHAAEEAEKAKKHEDAMDLAFKSRQVAARAKRCRGRHL